VHQRHRGCGPLVVQVREERGQLVGGEHALVDHGASGQRGQVDRAALGGGPPLQPLAQAERAPFQVERAGQRGGRGQEGLPELGHHRARSRTETGRVGRHLAPAEDGQPLLGGDLRGDLRHPLGRAFVDRHERDAGRVRPGRRQVDAGHRPVERVRDLHEQAGSVARAGLGAGRAAVAQVVQRGQGLRDGAVGGTTAQVSDHGEAAGVPFGLRVVEALGGRKRGEGQHGRLPSSATVLRAGTTSARGTIKV
jgi:hypothetical protein